MIRRLLPLIAAFTLVVPSFGARAAGQAGQTDDPYAELQKIARQIEAARDGVEQAERTRAALAVQIAESQKRLDQIAATKAVLERNQAALATRLAGATAALEKAQKNLDAVTVALVDAERRASDSSAKLAALREQVRRRVVGLYKGGQAALVDTILQGRDLRDIDARMTYVQNILGADKLLKDQLRIAEADYRELAIDLEAARKAQVAEVVRRDTAADTAKAAKDQVDDSLAVERERQAAEAAEREFKVTRVREAENSEAEYRQVLDNLEAARQAAVAKITSRPSGPPPPDIAAGRLVVPMIPPVPYPIGSGFGPRVHPILGYSRMHYKADMGGPEGDPIVAAAAGQVIEAGWCGGYGNCVIIDHGASISTLYAHQSAMAVTSGQRVGRGEVIGYIGSTGLSTGPHLHFEVYIGSEATDPAFWIY